MTLDSQITTKRMLGAHAHRSVLHRAVKTPSTHKSYACMSHIIEKPANHRPALSTYNKQCVCYEMSAIPAIKTKLGSKHPLIQNCNTASAGTDKPHNPLIDSPGSPQASCRIWLLQCAHKTTWRHCCFCCRLHCLLVNTAPAPPDCCCCQ
jgi:hypothetical protein